MSVVGPGPFRLDGRIVVITGAAGLLGRSHAAAVLEAGGHPVLADIAAEPLIAASRDLEATFGSDLSTSVVDITDERQVQRFAQEVWDLHGRVDGLINNAANNPKVEGGEGRFSRLEAFPLAAWGEDIAVGLTGAFLCAKHLGPLIARSAEGSPGRTTGSIINISSDLGLIAPDQRLYRQEGLAEDQQPVKPVTYSVVKSGLIGLTRYLSTYWPGLVRSNALCPGGVEQGQPEEFVRNLASRIPLGRMANANEYRGAVTFLLSDASSYMNGAVLAMDGGRSAW